MLLTDLIEQSQFETEEGNLLKTLTRLCNQSLEKTISSIQIELGKVFIHIFHSIFQNPHFCSTEDHRIRLDDEAKNYDKKLEGVLGEYERLENKLKDQEWATKLHSEILASKAEVSSVK